MSENEYEDLPEIRSKVAAIEHEIAGVMLEIEFNAAVAGLHMQPGWKALVDRLQTIRHGETMKLQTAKMDLYDLGKRQGRLQTLQMVVDAKPLTPQEVDSLHRKATMLRDQLEENRLLLQ